MNRPHTLAEVARRNNAGEQEFSSALREFLDEFYGALRVGTAADLIAAAPEAIGDPQRHAFLGAVGEHLARRWAPPYRGGLKIGRAFSSVPTSRRRSKASRRCCWSKARSHSGGG